MRAGVLSQPRVIKTIQEFYVPFTLNVTVSGFDCVQHLPALKHLEKAYTTNWRFAFGFASCIALDSEGKTVLGWNGASNGRSDEDPLGEKAFLEFLVGSLERDKQLSGIKSKMGSGQFKEGMAEMQQFMQGIMQELTKKFSQVRQEDLSYLTK